VTAVNGRAQAVGTYTDANGQTRGFRWERGRITTLDVPGAVATMVTDINDRGQIVGVYQNSAATPSPQATGSPPMDMPGPLGRIAG
jgi:uncharacterized membrane protein